jgi:hypothetical protein
MAAASVRLRFDPLRFTKRVVTAKEMRQLVAEAAYFRAANRDFAPGGEIDDWLLAEREVAESVVLGGPGPSERTITSSFRLSANG